MLEREQPRSWTVGIGTNAPIVAQSTRKLQEMFATAGAVIGSALTLAVRFKVSRKVSANLVKLVVHDSYLTE
jgi:hypothetical protein